MQEKKFRAWLKNSKKMVEVEEISFIGQKQIAYDEIEYRYTDKEPFHYTQWVDFEEIELMQYISKKDTNNTRICEGDIVTYAIRSVSGYCEATGIVKYNKETCAYEVEDIEDIDCTEILGYCEDLEVIGNIYENPELLEVQDDELDDEDDCKDFDIIDEDFGSLLDSLVRPIKY